MMDVLTSNKVHTRHDELVKMHKDPAYFAVNILPHHFYLPLAPVHMRVFHAIFSPSPFVNIVVPRKFGKTTVVNVAYPLYCIAFQTEKYILMCSETGPEAKSNLRTVKYEIVTNEKFKHYFGDLRVNRLKDEFGKWSEEYAKTSSGIYLAAKGAGAQVRGIKAIAIPPTLEIVDDPQGLQTILTKNTLDKLDHSWFEAEVMFARAKKWKKGKQLKEGKVRLLGTVVHRECIVNRKRSDSRFETVFMQAIEENENGEDASIWPEMYSLDDLLAEKENYARNGKLKIWMQERMNIPMSEEDKPFNIEKLKYWDDVNGLSYFDVVNGTSALVFEGELKNVTDEFVRI